MQFKDIDAAAVHQAIRRAASRFATMDICDATVVKRAHERHADDFNRYAIVGSFLSKRRIPLGIDLMRSKGPRGATWRKV